MSKFYVPISIYGSFYEMVEAETQEEAENKVHNMLKFLCHTKGTWSKKDKEYWETIKKELEFFDYMVSEAEEIKKGEQ